MEAGERHLELKQKEKLIFNELGKKALKDNLYLQKIFFLVTKLFPKEMEYFDIDYSAYNLGPYSTLVSETVERLNELDIIDLKNGDLSESGHKLLKKVENEDNQKANTLNEFLNKIEKLPKDELLYVIYTLYPNYTVNSKIKKLINSHLFESATIKLENLSEDKETTFITDKGNKIRVKKSNGKIVIFDWKGFIMAIIIERPFEKEAISIGLENCKPAIISPSLAYTIKENIKNAIGILPEFYHYDAENKIITVIKPNRKEVENKWVKLQSI